MRAAILGTGTMGLGMARSMRRAGLDVTAWNRTRERVEPLADDDVTLADSVTDAVRGADVVITMVFDVDAVLAVTDELTAALEPGAVWLQSATVGPDGIARIAAAVPEGVRLVDAPVLGTKQPAEQGKLVVLVSGPPDSIDAARAALDAIGTKTVVAGAEVGRASALKLACNAWIASLTAGAAQSLALARGLGVDPELFLRAIEGGPADSPYAQLKGAAMLQGDYAASFSVDGLRKDLGLIHDAAEKHGLPTALLDGERAVFDSAAEHGHGADDVAAAYTAFDVSRD